MKIIIQDYESPAVLRAIIGFLETLAKFNSEADPVTAAQDEALGAARAWRNPNVLPATLAPVEPNLDAYGPIPESWRAPSRFDVQAETAPPGEPTATEKPKRKRRTKAELAAAAALAPLNDAIAASGLPVAPAIPLPPPVYTDANPPQPSYPVVPSPPPPPPLNAAAMPAYDPYPTPAAPPGVTLSPPVGPTFRSIMARCVSATASGKMTQDRVGEIVKEAGGTDLAALSSQPHLWPIVDALVTAALVGK